MFFTPAWMPRLLVVLLLFAAPVFAQTPNADASAWQICPGALADPTGPLPDKQWDLTLSPYTHHWNSSTEHHHVFLGALEQHLQGNRFCGLALFRNSFGQPSSYVYVGQQWNDLMGNPRLFAKFSAGLIHGYKGAYQDKIPFNDYGIAPAVIPSFGYNISKEHNVQVMLLGTAGVLFAYGHPF
jgi:hypothetical protein